MYIYIYICMYIYIYSPGPGAGGGGGGPPDARTPSIYLQLFNAQYILYMYLSISHFVCLNQEAIN